MFAPGEEADTGGSAEAQGGAGGVAPGHAGNDGTRGGQQHPQHTSQSVQQGDIIVMCGYYSFTLIITSDPSSVPLSQSPRTTVQRPPPRAETMLLKKRD